MLPRFHTALHTEQPFEALCAIVHELQTEGYQPSTILKIFEYIRTNLNTIADQRIDDLLLDTMDTIVGWCSPSSKLFPNFDWSNRHQTALTNPYDLCQLLMRVEETFAIPGRGLVLAPAIPLDTHIQPLPPQVLLCTPRGVFRRVPALFDATIFDRPRDLPPLPSGYLCRLPTMTQDSVPIGTEIWHIDEK